jgi:GNAT superfamily N-acetyltransferase
VFSLPQPRLRPYRYPGDTAAIEAMWIASFGERWPIAGEHIGRILAAQSRDHDGWCQVVVCSRPIGVIAYQQSRHHPSEGSIVLVLVHPRYRRRRVGTKMVEAALRQLRERGVSQVELGAWATPLFWHGIPEDCGPARKFFARLGWRYYEESSDLLLDLGRYQPPPKVMQRVAPCGLEFRCGTAADRELVLGFVREQFPGFLPYFEEDFERGTPEMVYLAQDSSRLQATLLMSKFPRCAGAHWYRLLGEDFCVTGALVVRRESRRRGIGLAATAQALLELKNQGYTLCYFHWTWMSEMYGKLGTRLWRRYSLGRLALT